MKSHALAAAAMLLALSGCGSSEPEPPVPPVVEAPKVKPLKEIDPAAYQQSVEAALAEMPRELRGEFQKLLVCAISQNKEAGIRRPLDAQFVRQLTQQLRGDPTAGSRCQP